MASLREYTGIEPPLTSAKRKSQLTTFTQEKLYLEAPDSQIAPPKGSRRAEFLKKMGKEGYGRSQVVPWSLSANEKAISEPQLPLPFQQAVGAGLLHV